MNQIENRQLINERKLDNRFYFQSLLNEACQKLLLGDSEVERIQLELFELMSKQVERYTNDESSSIRVEKAQQLLQSISYCIGIYLKSIPSQNAKIELLKEEKISVLFYHGMDEITTFIMKAKEMMEDLHEESLKVDNYAYHDTLFNGIPEFFHDYNIEFAAHEYAGNIDYPLCITISDLIGIEYMYKYLERFTFENCFCKKFSDDKIQMLLCGFSSESVHVLVNIFELVLTNALGCDLTGKSITDLSITAEDLIWLQKNLEHLSIEELENKLNIALEHIAAELEVGEKIITYSKKAISQIVIHLKQNLQTATLVKIWIPFVNPEKKVEAVIFEDGYQMEDDELRDLIEEIKDCRYTTDKIAMIREKVQSLNDLSELLEECFYEEEYNEVFKLLNDTELDYLAKVIVSDRDDYELDDINQLKDWQTNLLDYTKQNK